jgi:hypothetical protein
MCRRSPRRVDHLRLPVAGHTLWFDAPRPKLTVRCPRRVFCSICTGAEDKSLGCEEQRIEEDREAE